MNNHSDKEIWIFLSHSHEDYDRVCTVRNILEEQNMRPLMFFLKCLSDKDEITNLIYREIDCRTRFILCDSPNARKSNWVKTEVDYIKEAGKPYEIIDLSKSDEEIKRDLVQVTRKMRVFISYTRRDIEVARAIYNRLMRYDMFTTWFDESTLRCGVDFEYEIRKNLKEAINNGYVICLVSEHSLRQNTFSYNELRMIDRSIDDVSNFGYNVLPIYLSRNLLLDDFRNLNSIAGIYFDGNDVQSLIDKILIRIIGHGNLMTYASNFEKGHGGIIDLEESRRLTNLYNSISKKSEVEHKENIWIKIISKLRKR